MLPADGKFRDKGGRTMRGLFKMVLNAVIAILAAVCFAIPLVVFAVIDWIIDAMIGYARMVDSRLDYWKPFEKKG